MDMVQLHLVLNHLPLPGIILSLTLLIAGMALGNHTLKRLSLLGFFCVTVLTTFTYLTGEPAEEIVADIPGIPAHVIETHEEFALWGLLSTALLGVVSLAGLVLYKGKSALPQVFVVSVLILSLFAGGVMVRTVILGSEIRHAASSGV